MTFTFFGIEFSFTPAIERRVQRVLDDLKSGDLQVEDAIPMLLDLVNGFIGSFEGDPQFEQVAKGLAGQRLAVEVEGVAAVTGTLSPGGEVRIERSIRSGVPVLRVRDLDTFGLLLAGRLDDVEALRSGRVRVVHMSDLLKLLAPVVALQSKRKQEFRDRIRQAADRVLRERGY